MDGRPVASSPPFVGFYSPWKTVGLTAFICVLAMVPMIPGFSNHVHYTAFFYTRLGYPFLATACVIMLLLALGMLPMVFRAVLARPAIEISGDTVRVWSITKWREYPLSCVTKARRQSGSLLGRCPDGKSFAIPLWLYRRPQEIRTWLTRRK
jgi:hypothetical protein